MREGGYELLARLPRRRAHGRGRHRRRSRTPACAASAAPASRPGASGASCAASPAPRLMAVNGDEGEPGTFKDRYYLERDPHRFLEGMLIARLGGRGRREVYIYLRDEYPAVPRDPASARSPRSRRPACRAARPIHLRRGAGAYICGEESAMIEIDRGQARHAAPPAALRRPGRPVRPADARSQHRDAVLGARHRREGRRVVRRPRPQRPQGPAHRSRCRAASKKPGVQARAGRHHRARADRRVLRRHGRRPHASRPICRAARRAASCRRRWPTSRSISARSSRTAASSARPRSSSCPTRTTCSDAALNLMRFFEDESCGQCTPCRVGTEKAVDADGAAALGRSRCSTSCRRRCATRRSAASARRRPTRCIAVMKYFREEFAPRTADEPDAAAHD